MGFLGPDLKRDKISRRNAFIFDAPFLMRANARMSSGYGLVFLADTIRTNASWDLRCRNHCTAK
ncbi:hypothetical protein [Variovorax durovernensis]